jgi:hypothetical protein
MKKLICHILAVAITFQSVAIPTARAAVVQQHRTAITATRANIGNTECDNIYAGCMDQFCIGNNVNAGRCQCSNDFAALDAQWDELGQAEIQLLNQTARAIEDIEAGARAQINRMPAAQTPVPAAAAPGQSRVAAARSAIMTPFAGDLPTAQTTDNDIAARTGVARFSAADAACAPRLPQNCDLALTRMVYQNSIRSDCRAYELTIQERRNQSTQARMLADQQVRAAAMSTFESSNRWNSSECLFELNECMRQDTVCGRNWQNCFDGRLAQNRDKCEHIMDSCINVREAVWNNFVVLAAPDIEIAQGLANSSQRQRCLRDVSECIARACADTIGTDGDISYASCMVNPGAIRTRCRVELDRCGSIPGIFELAARRWDAKQIDTCRTEVRECFTREDACGPDWTKCVGLSMSAMRRMCPVDRLVVCRRGNPNFSMADLDDILTGVYLAMDNAVLDRCNDMVNNKMMEICGGLNRCDRFQRLEHFGAESLRREQVAGAESITGMVSWNLVDVHRGDEWSDCMRHGRRGCDRLTRPGTLLIDEYMAEFDRVNRDVRGRAAMRARVLSELETVQRDINNIMREFENDVTVNQCIGGRDLSQVTGQAGDFSEGRFPLMTNSYRMLIARAALDQAALNHEVRVQALRSEIIRESSILNAEFECYTRPFMIGPALADIGVQTSIQAKMYNTDISDAILDSIQEGVARPYRTTMLVARSVTRQDIAELAGRRENNAFGGGPIEIRYETWAMFNQDTRICQTCLDITMCTTEERGSNSLFGRIAQFYQTIAVACALAVVSAAMTDLAKKAEEARNTAEAARLATETADIALSAATQVTDATGTISYSLVTTPPPAPGIGPSNVQLPPLGSPPPAPGIGPGNVQLPPLGPTTVPVNVPDLQDVASIARVNAADAHNVHMTARAHTQAGGTIGGGANIPSGNQGANIGEEIAWAAGNLGVSIGASVACTAIAELVPPLLGRLIALGIAAAAYVMSLAFKSVDVRNVNYHCEVVESRCEDFQM